MAAVITDYYLYNKKTGLYSYEKAEKLPKWRLIPCLSALVGIGVDLLCNYTSVLAGLTAVLPAAIAAMLAAFLFMVIVNTITKNGVVNL